MTNDQDKTADPPPSPAANAPVAPMRLRAKPPRVTRLSRKVLASLGLIASVGIGGALIYALQSRDVGKTGEELFSTDNRTTADGLTGLPRDYAGPLLGPPLPGDLGRPILNAQNRGQAVVPPPVAAAPQVDPESNAAWPSSKPHEPAGCSSRPVSLRPTRRRDHRFQVSPVSGPMHGLPHLRHRIGS
jgi:type IV secretion system protein VirB10